MYQFVWLPFVCLPFCCDILLHIVVTNRTSPSAISNCRNFGLCLIFESQYITKCLFDFIEDLTALAPARKFVFRFGYVFQMSYFVPLPTALAFSSFLENTIFLVKLKVLRAVTVNNTVFCNALPCSRQQSKHKSIRELLVRYKVHFDFYRMFNREIVLRVLHQPELTGNAILPLVFAVITENKNYENFLLLLRK
jgi:hypothetical protein